MFKSVVLRTRRNNNNIYVRPRWIKTKYTSIYFGCVYFVSIIPIVIVIVFGSTKLVRRALTISCKIASTICDYKNIPNHQICCKLYVILVLLLVLVKLFERLVASLSKVDFTILYTPVYRRQQREKVCSRYEI